MALSTVVQLLPTIVSNRNGAGSALRTSWIDIDLTQQRIFAFDYPCQLFSLGPTTAPAPAFTMAFAWEWRTMESCLLYDGLRWDVYK
jgi:hypothetical protein